MARWLWLAVLAGGCSTETFACIDHEQCVLSGAQGVCQPNGHCAYPDASCPSGYRFTLAGGGTCVSGEVMDSGADASDDVVDSGPDDSGSASGSAEGDPTSGSGMMDGGTSTACEDPNDAPTPVDHFITRCLPLPVDGIITGVLDGTDDVDEYAFTYPSDCTAMLLHVASVNSDDPMRVCMYADCASPVVVCGLPATSASLDGQPGCCLGDTDDPQPDMTLTCLGQATVRVVLDDAGGACVPYSLVYGEEIPPD